MMSRHIRVRSVLNAVNIFMPFGFGITLMFFNRHVEDATASSDPEQSFPFWGGSNFVFLYLNGLVQLISAVYIGNAVLHIRAHIREEHRDGVNIRWLVINFAAFGLYMLSLLAYYVAYTIIYIDISNLNDLKTLFYFQMVSVILSTFAQFCLCAIIWKVSAKK
jgi:hypothetical protein